MLGVLSIPTIRTRRDWRDDARVRVALGSVAFTLLFAWVCTRWDGSDGRTAAWSDGINLLLFGGYAWQAKDRALSRLMLAAVVLGTVELLADFFCVHCTGTLDYGMSRSALVLASPWWMPLSWAVVAVQIGISSDATIRRYGAWRGTALGGLLLGAVLIPAYEELAWGARWWRYQHCLCIGHTPVYIVLAEAIIGAGLAGLGRGALRWCTARAAVGLGLAVGVVTILGGTVGWGVVEFIGRGARPAWPWH